MASLLENKTINGVCRVRLTPRQNDCSFLAGANSYTLDSPLELSITPEAGSVGEIEKEKLNGVKCFYRPETSYVKSLTIAGKFCEFCPDAFAEFFGWNTYIGGGDNYAIGMPVGVNNNTACAPTGVDKFSMEIIAPVAATGGICTSTTGAYVKIIVPVMFNVMPGELPFANDDTLDFSFTASAVGDNGTYGNGPFNDFGGGTGTVLENDGLIIENLPVGFTMPAASCTPTPVPTQAGE